MLLPRGRLTISVRTCPSSRALQRRLPPGSSPITSVPRMNPLLRLHSRFGVLPFLKGTSFLLLGPLIACLAGSRGPETLRFETDLGPATMNHRMHQNAWTANCSVCHHIREKGRKKPCRECHKGRAEAEEREGGAPSYFEVKMRLCRGCHLKRREADSASKAPIHCEECHDIKAKTQNQGSGAGISRSRLGTSAGRLRLLSRGRRPAAS